MIYFKLLSSDTATIQCVTLLPEDSLMASELSNVLLGSYIDPVFGLSQASIYAQIQLGNIPNVGGGSLTADSLVIALAYTLAIMAIRLCRKPCVSIK